MKSSKPVKGAVEYSSFIALLGQDAEDIANSAARREWEIYHRLSVEDRLDVHRREILRLERSAEIDAELKIKFLAIDREALKQLEHKAREIATEAAKKAEAAPLYQWDDGSIHAEAEPTGEPYDRLRDFRERDGEYSIEPPVL